jgi:hypothetical protein
MTTQNHNIVKDIKDIARITLDTLDNFGIEFDEIIFGKPIADIYIDDRIWIDNNTIGNVAE